jgi:hypothetical protein
MGLAQGENKRRAEPVCRHGGRRNERRVGANPIEGLGGIWPMEDCGDCHGGFVVGQMWWDYPERADG